MIPSNEKIDEELMASEQELIDAVKPDVEAAWAAQVAASAATVSAIPDNQKGRYLAPIAKLSIGKNLEPEGLSDWGKAQFQNMVREVRVAALKPLYP